MRTLFFALTVINSLLLVLLLGHSPPATGASAAPVLRGSALEIVDAEGRVRASIGVLPQEPATDGKAHPATVLFRLIDEAGQPSVKIGTDGTVAGMSLVGGDDQSYLVLQADGPESSLKFVEPAGKTVTLGPS